MGVRDHGEVVEWLMAPASKADERDERSESSNLSLSATNATRAMLRCGCRAYRRRKAARSAQRLEGSNGAKLHKKFLE